MVRGRRVCAAGLLAAAFVLCCASRLSRSARADGDEEDAPHFLLFSGRDFWRNGAFLYGGTTWAPAGFEQDGFLFKLLLAGVVDWYNAGDLDGDQVVGAEARGAIMAGWRMKRGPLEAKVFFGPEFQNNWLWPDDPGNRLRGRAVGLRFAIDLWMEPSPATMISGYASLSTIGANYAARAAYGWKLFDMFYAGPETQVYGGDGYAQVRFGAHLTSLKTGVTEWSAAGGWAIDSDERDSIYLRLGLMQRR
jgi:hypothetical protein